MIAYIGVTVVQPMLSPSAGKGDICPFPQSAPCSCLWRFHASTCDILSPSDNEGDIEAQESSDRWVKFAG